MFEDEESESESEFTEYLMHTFHTAYQAIRTLYFDNMIYDRIGTFAECKRFLMEQFNFMLDEIHDRYADHVEAERKFFKQRLKEEQDGERE